MSVDFSKLSKKDQESLRPHLGEVADRPPVAAPAKPKRGGTTSAGGRKRAQTGKEFEAELATFHQALEFHHWGKVRRNWPPTRVVGKGKRVLAGGGGDVDYSGWVRVDTCGYWSGAALSVTTARVIPIAFDAKVNSTTSGRRGWYRHDRKLQHQLHGLKAAAEAGEHAFLLVLERGIPRKGMVPINRVFAVPILNHFQDLLGDGVRLWEFVNADQAFPLLPSVEKDPVLGWSWIPLLRWCAP